MEITDIFICAISFPSANSNKNNLGEQVNMTLYKKIHIDQMLLERDNDS